jgi:hypothetical protein
LLIFAFETKKESSSFQNSFFTILKRNVMSYLKVDFKAYDEHKKRVELLSKLHEKFVYSKETSLSSYQVSVEELRLAAEAKNKQIEILNKISDAYNAALAKADKIVRICVL